MNSSKEEKKKLSFSFLELWSGRNYHHNHKYHVFNKCLLQFSVNLNCSSAVLRSVRMVKYSPTAFSIIAHTWQLNANHYVNFLARFLGLVASIPITSLRAHVRSALIGIHCSGALKTSFWPCNLPYRIWMTAGCPQPNIYCNPSFRGDTVNTGGYAAMLLLMFGQMFITTI